MRAPTAAETERLLSARRQMLVVARRVGSLHAWWDYIDDIGHCLNHERTSGRYCGVGDLLSAVESAIARHGESETETE